METITKKELLTLFAPWQLLELLVVIGFVVLIVVLVVKLTKPKPMKFDLNQLEKLNDLKEKGIITEDEFNAKKREILNK